MYRYLFICNENIGRSQMAEGFYNSRKGEKLAISTGLIDSSKKYNGHPRPDVIQVMNEVGIDVGNHQIKHLTEKILEMAEIIIVFCDKNMCPDIVTSKDNVVYTKIDDPPDKDKTLNVLREMRNNIKLIVDILP